MDVSIKNKYKAFRERYSLWREHNGHRHFLKCACAYILVVRCYLVICMWTGILSAPPILQLTYILWCVFINLAMCIKPLSSSTCFSFKMLKRLEKLLRGPLDYLSLLGTSSDCDLVMTDKSPPSPVEKSWWFIFIFLSKELKCMTKQKKCTIKCHKCYNHFRLAYCFIQKLIGRMNNWQVLTVTKGF